MKLGVQAWEKFLDLDLLVFGWLGRYLAASGSRRPVFKSELSKLIGLSRMRTIYLFPL